MALHEVQLKGYNVRPGNLSLGTFGSYGIEQLHVTLDDTWSGLAVTATFNPPKGEPREIRLPENGLIDVPAEATANEGTGTIVYCGVANGVQRITKTQGYNVITRGPVGGTEPFKPSESLATQVLQAALNAEKNSAEAKSVADNLRNDAANGKFDGKDGAKGDKGDKGDTGDKGNTGAKGDKGDKGFSPTATVTQLENGAEIAITDEEGTTKATVKNGSKGDKGDRGSDGVSPTISVEDIENGHRVTIVDATGTTSVDIYNGEDGTDGKDGAQVDDSAIGEKPWSSKHIIDMLCPPIEESGNPVVCYPVAGYQLGVKASWEPVQEGSGDPSPDNVRQIKGRDRVKVERLGENLFNRDGLVVGAPVYSTDGVLSSYEDVAVSYVKVVPGAQYSIRLRQTDDTILYTRIAFLTKSKKFIKRAYMLNTKSGMETKETFTVSTDCEWIQFGLNNGRTFNYNFDVVFVAGSAPTTYIPYIGSTNTLTLPETVYEGEVDAVNGEGQETWKMLTLDGTINKFTQSDRFWRMPSNSAPGVVNGYVTMCSHFPANTFGGNQTGNYIFTRADIMSRYFPDVNALNAYIAAQNAAGTPVQIAYKLAEPVPFTATGAQPLPALVGVNTVLTDADSATVTGRADPIKRITDLEDATASQT